MNYRIEDLKEAVNRLEYAVHARETDDVDMYVRLIKNIAAQIKTDYWSNYVEHDEIVIQPISKISDYKTINTIEFLYKPMHFINIYEGNEIEYFAKERTEELLESGAIEAHNDFWQSHEIIYGNVYGSVPLELTSKDSVGKLIRCGWRKANVDIIEFKDDLEDSDIREIAEQKFRHYIIIKEIDTQGVLLLRYQF
jgi:hypothetical protein